MVITILTNAQAKNDGHSESGIQKKVKLSIPSKTNTQENIEIPFEVYEGIIYVQASLNGEQGTFILDSGAPELILNSDAENINFNSTYKSEASGVGGKVRKAGSVHINTFEWSGIKLNEGDVLSVSMSHLTKRSILGLIGYSVFNDYTLTFDYKKRKIFGTLHSSLVDEKEVNGELLARIPFEMYKHIPVLQIGISGEIYNMGLDTGAAANLFYEKYVPELKESIIRYKETDLTGIGGKIKAKKGRIKKLTIRDVEYHRLHFVFEDATLNALNKGSVLKLDGLLGYEFLKSYKTTIDFKAKEIRIYK